MKTSSILIALTMAILAVSIWALANRPDVEPPWPQRIQGLFLFALSGRAIALHGNSPHGEPNRQRFGFIKRQNPCHTDVHH